VLFSVQQCFSEAAMGEFERITMNPAVMGGKACIRGMRVTVSMVVGQVAAGHSFDEILDSFPYLEREDITEALRGGWVSAKSVSPKREDTYSHKLDSAKGKLNDQGNTSPQLPRF
jgi:uncharacterized protein (DUF433 family)